MTFDVWFAIQSILLVLAGFFTGIAAMNWDTRKWRRITLEPDAASFQQLQKIAIERGADMSACMYRHWDPGERCSVTITLKDGPESREINFTAESFDSAARLVLERVSGLAS